MKKYKIKVSEAAENDLENIISYLRHNLSGDILADNYKLLLRNITNYQNSRKVRWYI